MGASPAKGSPWWIWGLLFVLLACSNGEEELPLPDGTEPPEVVATVPAEGGLLTPDGTIQVIFSKPVTLESAQNGITIIGVAVEVSLDATRTTATVRPLEPLEPGGAYTLVIKNITDQEGAEMETVVTVNFTVAAEE
ncbi:MAG: hypothetical protein KatS3mg115_2163 [Candidatus Poribacteria bacterium]|nr:MAG: hypothetical protein KatS3mg115_2163 [Candidatus Poribacteria bacterium]